MQSHLSSPWNNAVAFLFMLYGEQSLSSGSCFFWRFDGRTYLLTNWHNLSGRNPFTCQPMSETGGVPDRIRFMAYKRVSEPDTRGYFQLDYLPVEVELCKPDLREPKWFEHPSFGRRVDVAALDVTDAVQGFQIDHANTLESDAMLEPTASQDVFVVGFPFGLIANAPAPVWKRGSIAIDPTFDPEGLPKMLVDTATREGMSGSLVIARHLIVGRQYPKKDGTMSEPVLYSKLDLVVGMYSGRHYPDLEKAQLGIVWKRSAIEETVKGGKAATA
jgi:hypothetical protein